MTDGVRAVYDQAIAAISAPYKDFTDFHLPLSVYYIATSFVIAAVWAWRSRQLIEPGFKKILLFLFPREIILHPSSLFDLQYYLLWAPFSALLFAAGYLPTVWINNGMVAGLTRLFGPPATVLEPGLTLTIIETVCYVLVFDLAYWARHWAMHRVPWLWEFHKAHHSAEVLTPFTTARGHPFEEISQSLVIAFSTGLVHGVFLYLNGPQAHDLMIWQVNVLMLLYYFTFFNLRHTHFWIVIDGPLGHIIQSPAHHQIHHSAQKKHWDKNFGYCLSLWDWVFGTLYIPKRDEKLTFGIGAESAEYRRLWPFLTLPFVKIARQLRGGSGISRDARTESPRNGTAAPPPEARTE